MPYTSSEIKSYLADANKDYTGRKTWESMYGAIDYSEQKGTEALQSAYADAVGQAYDASLKSAQNIMSSNVGTGYKTQAMLDNEAAVLQAYESYKQNYMSNLQSLQQQTAQAGAQITNALTTEAENINALYNTGYDYLQYLRDNYEGFADDSNFNTYLDEEGNLLGRDALENMFFDKINLQGDAALNVKGQDFYDKMLNWAASSSDDELRKYSYGNWLARENPELFEWARSANPYDYETSAKRLDVFQKAFTGEVDDEYNPTQRDWAINSEKYLEQWNKYTSGIQDNIDKLDKKHWLDTVDTRDGTATSAYDATADSLRTLAQYVAMATDVDGDAAIELKSIMNKYDAKLNELSNEIRNQTTVQYTTSGKTHMIVPGKPTYTDPSEVEESTLEVYRKTATEYIKAINDFVIKNKLPFDFNTLLKNMYK